MDSYSSDLEDEEEKNSCEMVFIFQGNLEFLKHFRMPPADTVETCFQFALVSHTWAGAPCCCISAAILGLENRIPFTRKQDEHA